MADQTQIVTQIRFGLEQLSERNAQHEWEHLCRHFARERICSNILPATGPVQAGGDQGRDFETFRTYLKQSNLRERSFVGLISDKPLAFACTLDKVVPSKVKRDVKTIMSSGTSIEGIYFFCTRGLATAKRHELQQWAQDEYKVTLEILDGAAISEQLCDRDLFWLAERYLQIPSELFPALTVEEEQDWYARTLHKWRHENRLAQTFADFSEIRAAGRDALGPFAYDEEGRPRAEHKRPELSFWIEKLDEIESQDTFSQLRRRSLYEACVLRLRGFDSLLGQEERIRFYFADVPAIRNAVDLEDASNLLSYLQGANRYGKIELVTQELVSWVQVLARCLDELLREAKQHSRTNERCALLETRGRVSLLSRAQEGVLDADELFIYWKKLSHLAQHAPLFPLEKFADRLAAFARFIGTHPEYESLAESVDSLVAQRFGQFKAAEKCMQRAISFREAGDLPRAMNQLHHAKIDWFAEEALGKSIIALNWLSDAYTEQGLLFAAKYYALAAAFTALHSEDLQLKSLIARSVERAAESDYLAGAWHGFLELAESAAVFYPHFAHDPTEDFNSPNGVLQRLIYPLALLPVLTRELHPDLEAFAKQRSESIIERLNLIDVLEEVRPTAEANFANVNMESLEEQLAGPPWSDAGPERHTQWSAHGILWKVRWNNDYETTIAAEEFSSALQIFLSDLAGYDLCFMCTTVNVSIELAADDKSNSSGYMGFDIQFKPSNDERLAVVTLPSYRSFADQSLSRSDLQVGALSVVSGLLQEASLLPTSRFHQILEERFKQGLQNKLHIAAPYSQCFSTFIDAEHFAASERVTVPPTPLLESFASKLPNTLSWFTGFGFGYDPEETPQIIKNRYAGFSLPIERTLQRLRAEPGFRQVVLNLRNSGWKDWHILSAVFHSTMNYRLNQRKPVLLNQKAEMEAMRRVTHEPEPEDALPVPIEEYSEEKLRQTMPVYMVTCLKTYGLENHQLTPDFTAIEDFLSNRYNFWTDDVEHTDPF